MADSEFDQEANDFSKPKSNRRRGFFSKNVEESAEETAPEVAEEVVSASESDSEIAEEIAEKKVGLLFPEPKASPAVAAAKRLLGLNKTMEEKKWAKRTLYKCTKCGWETFDKSRARVHAC